MNRKTLFLDADIVLMVVLGVFAGAFLIETRTYNPTAALFPRLVSIISLIFIVWTIVQRVFSLAKRADQSPEARSETGPQGARVFTWYWSLAAMVGYYVLIYLLGFTLVTLVYLIVLPLLLGYRRYLIILITGVLWTVAFLSVFNYILHARIPEGIVGSFLRQCLKGL